MATNHHHINRRRRTTLAAPMMTMASSPSPFNNAMSVLAVVMLASTMVAVSSTWYIQPAVAVSQQTSFSPFYDYKDMESSSESSASVSTTPTKFSIIEQQASLRLEQDATYILKRHASAREKSLRSTSNLRQRSDHQSRNLGVGYDGSYKDEYHNDYNSDSSSSSKSGKKEDKGSKGSKGGGKGSKGSKGKGGGKGFPNEGPCVCTGYGPCECDDDYVPPTYPTPTSPTPPVTPISPTYEPARTQKPANAPPTYEPAPTQKPANTRPTSAPAPTQKPADKPPTFAPAPTQKPANTPPTLTPAPTQKPTNKPPTPPPYGPPPSEQLIQFVMARDEAGTPVTGTFGIGDTLALNGRIFLWQDFDKKIMQQRPVGNFVGICVGITTKNDLLCTYEIYLTLDSVLGAGAVGAFLSTGPNYHTENSMVVTALEYDLADYSGGSLVTEEDPVEPYLYATLLLLP